MNKTPSRHFLRIAVLILLIAAAASAWVRFGGKEKEREPPKPMVVRAGEARIGNVDVYFKALGTVTSPNTVTVRSRVDGELIALHLREGRFVKEGDLLAEIDPRPFEVQKMQAEGQLARDEALLKQAKQELERYRKLIREHSVSAQQLETQEGLVGQYEGAVLADRAAVADAELQLTYSRVTAPVSGRVGLRKVDVGNMIRSSDSDGIVVITQMQPMDLMFTLVEKQIPEVVQAMRSAGRDETGDSGKLLVEAWGQDNQTLLATGELLTIDNQIDTSTGTVKAKARFANDDYRLFPNQFVNARLKVKTMENVLVIPGAAVQRNNDGFFVYVVEDGKSRARTITTLYTTDTEAVVGSGLKAGDVVVTDGVDRLRDGMRVAVTGTNGIDGSGTPPGGRTKETAGQGG